ncbi:excinuclease ABC subunit UvrC [Dietzia sp.]|uniref:excinuclease ABC subunit UvrC n=1 Tax=Dietzia sp. TaxID=1871616 RepID=UPI002FD989A0
MDPQKYRPATGTIPTDPGVYRFRDEHGRVIYVGKAKNLRARLSNYFQDLTVLHPRTRQMVTSAAQVTWTVVGTEVEALQLEYTWIKKYDPRFNVRYKDGKTYPMLAVTLNEEYPRLFVYRGPRRKGVRYFGPYSHAWAIRDTLDTLTRVFPARTCTSGVFKRHGQLGRPCLLGYINKCSAPCVGRVSAAEHRAIVLEFCDFLSGNTGPIVRRLKREMTAAAEDLDFERAARLRDDLAAIERTMEKQNVVLEGAADADVVGVELDELEASVQVFHVRSGRIQGQRRWVVEHSHGVGEDGEFNTEEAEREVVADFLAQFYGAEVEQAKTAAEPAGVAVPREVLVPALPDDAEAVTELLGALRGSKVSLRVPQRGEKRDLADTVRRNAMEALKQHKMRRSGDLTTRSEALAEIADTIGLDEAPLRIECVDISHTQGTDVMASLVVFEDGLPKKADYRTYRIAEAAGEGHSDDVASIAEVTRRRFRRHLEAPTQTPEDIADEGGPASVAGAGATSESAAESTAGTAVGASGPDPVGEAAAADGAPKVPRRFAYPPQLYVVDGGQPQVEAAQAVLDELGITDVPVVGIAKRLEEIWVPGEEYPIIFPRQGQGLYMLQRLRDEAHRFAIKAHRGARSKRMTSSALDSVPGLGPARKKALLDEFGSVAAIRRASTEDLRAVPGIGAKAAETIAAALSPRTGGPDRNVEDLPEGPTGEAAARSQ